MKVPLSDAAKEILNSPSASRSFMQQMLTPERDAEGKLIPRTVYVPETGNTYEIATGSHYTEIAGKPKP